MAVPAGHDAELRVVQAQTEMKRTSKPGGALLAAAKELRPAYDAVVDALLGNLLPRIDGGAFLDLGDCFKFVSLGDPRLPLIWTTEREARDGESLDHFMKRARERDWDAVEKGPGIVLLEWTIEDQPLCKTKELARLVGCASPQVPTLKNLETDGLGGGGADWQYLARFCLARDLRAAYRRRYPGRARALTRSWPDLEEV